MGSPIPRDVVAAALSRPHSPFDSSSAMANDARELSAVANERSTAVFDSAAARVRYGTAAAISAKLGASAAVVIAESAARCVQLLEAAALANAALDSAVFALRRVQSASPVTRQVRLLVVTPCLFFIQPL